MTLFAHAKINLSLRILGKRADGFHEVVTRMAPLQLHDVVTVEPIEETDRILITSNDPDIPTDGSNLMAKAASALAEELGIHHGWRMHVEKHIPFGAGLGGGSSDAAAVLIAINQILRLGLSVAELARIGGRIGSDVPFFLFGGVCDATGRGEEISPVDFPWQFDILLVKPPFGIPTPWAYKAWADSKVATGVDFTPQVLPWGEMVNDLERPVFQKHLMLPILKQWLREQLGVRAAMMSGSGSTIFAVLEDGVDGLALQKLVQEFCGDSTWVCLTRSMAAQPL
ncbi:MAG: 4-(cytidine 5'-diphospho)-2-C-methyl-D-erythritol kinase [Verrucomicrobiaceae bacterium]|nr:4-(cytidine 5'-diphospho)-2-C-methyl-D-erythritol kinase [Verrucomicrobiaceae bacterium]